MRRRILITGASSGIGKVTAQRLGAAGHLVVGTCRHPEAQPELPFEMLALDVDDDASVQALFRRLEERDALPDVLVHCAGSGIAGPLEETSDALAKAQFETNFFGAHRVVRAALPHLRARARARDGEPRNAEGPGIILIGSLAGLITLPFQGMYCATKHALEAYAECLRYELRPLGVRVTLVEPGDFKTDFTFRRRYTETDEASVYHAAMRSSLDVTERDEQAGPPPERVAARVESLLGRRRWKIRYPVGNGLQGVAPFAAKILPASWFEALIARMYLG